MVKEAQKKVEDTSEVARHKSMAISYAKDLVVADKLTLDELLDEAEVIYRFIVGDFEEIKVAEETGRETPVRNARELMKWAASHGKEFTPTWVRAQANIKDAVITDEMAVEAHWAIKEIMGWE